MGATEIDTSGCDREPIHIPGAIQPHGALIALGLPALTVTQAAGCTEALLGQAPEAVIGRALADLFDPDSIDQIHDILEFGGDPPVFALGLRSAGGDGPVDGVVHVIGQTAIVEMQPRLQGEGDLNRAMSRVRRMMASLQTSGGTLAFLDAAAREVRQLTGFDRVMIYRFREDESGEVLAEAAADGLETWLGLRYPASDIPRQARELYKRNWLRLIDDVDYAPAPVMPVLDPATARPLDMSHSALRSVSPIHLQYLKNMGVRASMSISIIVGNRLWGLIACHHYDGPRHMTFERRATCELFGQMFSLQLEAREQSESFERRSASRRTYDALIQHLSREPDFGVGLTRYQPNLQDYIESEGVAVLVDGRFSSLGRTPDEATVRRLAAWLKARGESAVFTSSNLSADWPEGHEGLATAAGVLALCVSPSAADYIFWFRAEVSRQVTWAGNPDKAVDASTGQLRPRASFEEWIETVREQSEPWTAFEIELAEVLRLSLLEVVVRHLEESNAERTRHEERQNLLMAELDHRVKNTLANIQALVAQTSKQAGSLESFTRSLERRIRSMAKAQSLLTKTRWEGVSMRSLMHEELAAYENSGNLDIAGTPAALQPKAALALSLAVHELATNAAKYGALSTPDGHVSVTWREDPAGGLLIDWRERGGPAVSPPGDRGFGSTLIERALALETGGSVQLTFEPEGVRCVIMVPADQVSAATADEAEAFEAAPQPAAPVMQGRRVLVVEDSALVMMSLEAMIEEMGWTIADSASRLDEAMEKVDDVDADVAILDVNLDGDASWPIAERLAERGIPFLFATGYDGATVLPAALADAPVIGKPFMRETLAARLSALVSGA